MMNNVVLTAAPSSSECSSGCESGWTLYLEHSSSSFSTGAKCNINKHQKVAATFHQGKKSASLFYDDDDDDEDEDLSMVSDASSGPPHFDHEDDEDEVFCYSSRKKQSVKLSTLHQQQQQQYFQAQDFGLDDTASSPLFTSERNNGGENKVTSLKRMVDYSSQGFSATHFHQVVLDCRKRRQGIKRLKGS
ncbi:uncharacterized protein LOC110684950 isoform X2 [Chenopodium quinoa]|uniref:uncharacterized protein LOC110684950 isoform X2 n=1 Tax=Chenopodium quinoa TaxID=63459 RepID=UPI000B791B10|nr:uncharacterized protein LOC110684950 isoform X2 [Chenopodium quinoa]